MKITIATYFDYEGYSFDYYETDDMNQPQKEKLARRLVEEVDESILIKELDANAENLGEDIFAILEKLKAKKEAATLKRSLAAKKAWAVRKSTL